MDAEGFIDAIKRCVHDSAVHGVLQNTAQPPGKFPSAEELRFADWFKNLSDEDRMIIENIVKAAVTQTLFGFLCVLDGVRAIEDTPKKGWFEFYYVNESERTLLNDPMQEPLHDLYRG